MTALFTLADLDAGPGAALLRATCDQGFSEPVARAGLRAELDAWTAPGAIDAVLSELPLDLDAARRPAHVLVIAARTLPASTLRAALMARLLGADVALKPASGQSALAHAIADADPNVAVTAFEGSDRAARDRAIAEADAVVVLGSDATIERVRAAVPATHAFVGYGHRVSAAWIAERDPDDGVVAGLAADLCAWDQAGCLSPQVVWSAAPDALARRLADTVRDLERALPMALPSAAAASRLTARTRAEMLGTAHATDTALIATLPTPAFIASPGLRMLWVLPLDAAAVAAIASQLSTLACVGAPPPLPDHVRRCAPGQMQRPPLDWPHDGRPNLLPLLKPA